MRPIHPLGRDKGPFSPSSCARASAAPRPNAHGEGDPLNGSAGARQEPAGHLTALLFCGGNRAI